MNRIVSYRVDIWNYNEWYDVACRRFCDEAAGARADVYVRSYVYQFLICILMLWAKRCETS